MPPKFVNLTWNFIPVRSSLTNDQGEIKRRVLNLYKAWYRQIPVIFYDYHLPLSPEEGRSKLREIFVRNSRVTDPKAINMLIMKGEMELNESVNKQKEGCHIYKYFRSAERQPENFLTKFLDGK